MLIIIYKEWLKKLKLQILNYKNLYKKSYY